MTFDWQWPAAGWIDRAEMLAIPAIDVADQALLAPQPQVSVLMLTRNHAAYLEQAVSSVLDQRIEGLVELLIGEYYSSDETLGVALALQQRHPELIRVIHAHRNVGIRSNFLRLVCRARAPLLALLEGDDYWTDPDKLSLQCALLADHPEHVAAAAKTDNRTQWLPSKPAYGLVDLLRRYAVHTSTLVIRAEHLQMYPRFPDNVCWDSMLLAYLMARGTCGYLDRSMSYYRRHRGGLWHNANRFRRLQMSWECVDAIDAFFFGRFSQVLLDRELWFLGMDFALPRTDPWGHWRQSIRLLPQILPRLWRRSPVRASSFLITILAQPVLFLCLSVRHKLALRHRFKTLLPWPDTSDS
ncbi:glycosyltransferase [Synechococcus sp. 1G10]|uniref:glycosyltransferase n=1 Tax=Synechococcus sp. 1G10 TaxID=2025605 RepID=UPI000B982ADD|nr:glycosyltransferase [Synechococcus sp. 1G10]